MRFTVMSDRCRLVPGTLMWCPTLSHLEHPQQLHLLDLLRLLSLTRILCSLRYITFDVGSNKCL